MAFLLGLLVNYLLSARFVFSSRNVADRRMEITIYGAIGLVGLGLNEILIWVLTDMVGLYYLWSKVISAGRVFFWNFLIRKFTLFREKTKTPSMEGGNG